MAESSRDSAVHQGETDMGKQILVGIALLVGALLLAPATARAQTQVRCESYDHQTNFCHIGRYHGDVRIAQRLSDARCNEGSDWGVQGDQIWVTDGCRAIFEIDAAYGGGYSGRRRGGGDDDRYGRDRGFQYGDRRADYITCESNDYRRKYCEVGYHVRARLYEQLSDTPCVRGTNWLDTANGVWVSGGCRAVFKIR
jgi:hypothetical protein